MLERWHALRRAHPVITWTFVAVIIAMLGVDGWFVARRLRYDREIERLRSGMTDIERKRADAVMQSEQNRVRVALELVRRQAVDEPELHLSVSVDSGTMYLEQEGASLRDMPVDVAPEKTVGIAPDTIRVTPPRGVRTIVRLLGEKDAWEVPGWVYRDRGLAEPGERQLAGALGAAAVVLDGGTVIYSLPQGGPLSDSSYVMPGAVRARAVDLRAIAPDLKPGQKVYFY